MTTLDEGNYDSDTRNAFLQLASEHSRIATLRTHIEEHFTDKGYKELKQELGDLLVEKLTPIRERYMEIKRDKKYLSSVLYERAQKAREICSPIVKKAKKAMGLRT